MRNIILPVLTMIVILSIVIHEETKYEDRVISNKQTESVKNIESLITKELEIAYFEGQKDALRGDIRISLNKDSVYIWNKSCWDSEKKPIYNPSKEDTKRVNPIPKS